MINKQMAMRQLDRSPLIHDAFRLVDIYDLIDWQKYDQDPDKGNGEIYADMASMGVISVGDSVMDAFCLDPNGYYVARIDGYVEEGSITQIGKIGYIPVPSHGDPWMLEVYRTAEEAMATLTAIGSGCQHHDAMCWHKAEASP